MGALIVVLILVALYFVPTFIAAMRHHNNVVAIGALNFLLGWSFIGWVAAFVWALTSPSSPGPPVIVEHGHGQRCATESESSTRTESDNGAATQV